MLDTLKKIIIIGLVVLGLFVLYKRFMADTIEDFFRSKQDKVGFRGTPTISDKNFPSE